MINQPFFLEGRPGTDAAVLLIHGFTGNPTEVQPLGEEIAKAGYDVQGVLLPGHGGLPADLKGYRWQHWAEHAADALRTLRKTHTHVAVAGLSMGALTALHLAANDPEVKAVLAMSTPARINSPYVGVVKYARFLKPWFAPLENADFSNLQLRATLLRQLPPGVVVDFDNAEHVREVRRMSRVPTSAIDQLIRFNKVVVDELPRVRVPVLFAEGGQDRVIAPRSAEILIEQVGSSSKSIEFLANSAHMLPLEPDAAQLARRAVQFFAEALGGNVH